MQHQRSLFAGGHPEVDPAARWTRRVLDADSWVDECPGWLAGADTLLDELVDTVPWRHGRRRMYDRVLDDPRLSFRGEVEGSDAEWSLSPVLVAAGAALCDHYHVRFGAPAFNYYRDGRDSVAFHADRELRDVGDTRIAVLSLGSARPFLVRPKVGPTGSGARRTSVALRPGSGDLLVMGGACQQAFEHAVPKVARVGPRVSVSWRFAQEPRDGSAVAAVARRMPANRSSS